MPDDPSYEALLEVTTDKVDTEVPSPISGVVREIAVPEGTTVRVGTLLAVLDDDGAQSQAAKQPSSQAAKHDRCGHEPSTLDFDRLRARRWPCSSCEAYSRARSP